MNNGAQSDVRVAFTDNIGKLRSWGVTVLFGPDVYPLHEPGTGSQHLHLFPWAMSVQAIGRGDIDAKAAGEPSHSTGGQNDPA